MFVKGSLSRYWRYLLTFICGCAVISTGPACVTGGKNGGGGGGGGASPLLIITSISSSNITGVAATISWRTNRPADSQVEYGATTSYGNVVSLKTLVTEHQMTLFGLSPDTLYHYRVKSKDEAGNPSTSGDITFTTAKGGSPTPTPTPTPTPPPPGFPVIASFTASPIKITPGQSSTLSWTVTGATSLKLDPGGINVTGQTSRSVSPSATTTYQLTATNNVGSLSRNILLTVDVPPPPGVFVLAPYTGTFGEAEARILFDRFGFGAPPERIAQAVSEGLETTISKLTTWQSEGNLDAIVNDWVCDGWLSGEGLNKCSSSGTYDFHNKHFANSKLIKFLHSPNQYFYKLILFLHDERLAGSGLTEDPWFMRHAYVDHWNMLLKAANGGEYAGSGGDYKQFMRDWMKDSLGHVFWQDGEDNLKAYPNENFAREFWELGTVGTTNLDGIPNYTDLDIAAAARVHTGYSRSATLTDSTGQPYQVGVYNEANHATGAFDIFVGTPYYAKVSTQEQLLQATFNHPRTAEHLAEDLWKEFINPYKDPSAIRELASIIRHYGYNLTPVMQTIMRSKALYADGSKETLIKQPIELVIGLLRSFPGYSPASIHSGDDYTVLAWHTGALDQTFLSPNSIFGWEEKVLAGASYIKLWRDVSNQLLTKTNGSNGEHLAKYSLRANFWTGLSTTDALVDKLSRCFNVPLNAAQRDLLKNYLDTQPRLGQSALGSPFPSAVATQQEERIKGAIAILINQPSYRTK
jgi:hypothetical protein